MGKKRIRVGLKTRESETVKRKDVEVTKIKN